MPGLREYVDALDSFVLDTMRLRDAVAANEAAQWACERVHHDVEPLASVGTGESSKAFVGGIPPEELERLRTQRPKPIARRITLEASLHSGIVTVENGRRIEHHYTYPPSGEHDRFDDWEDLRQLAYSMVDREIASMRAKQHERHARQRPSARDRRERTLETLFAYLFLRAPRPNVQTSEGKAEDQRLRELSRMLAIKYPL